MRDSGKANLIVSEPGLYALIQKSRKDAAKRFKRWVNHEVLPTIRKTGGVYMTPEKAEEILADPDLIIGLAQQVKALKEERDEAVRTKAWISDKKTASAMGTASGERKKRIAMEKYVNTTKAKDKLRKEYRAFTSKGYRKCEHCGYPIDHNKPAYGVPTGEKMPWMHVVHARCFENHLEVRAVPRQYADNMDF